MPSVINKPFILGVIMVGFIMPNVIMLSVVAPFKENTLTLMEEKIEKISFHFFVQISDIYNNVLFVRLNC
jgi:hypothetical protein